MDDPIYDNDDPPSEFVRETLDKASRASFGVLKKYYQQTVQPVYAIAVAMDPTSKYQWWKDACWPEDWIATAKDQVQDAWEKWKVMYLTTSTIPASDQHDIAPLQKQHHTRRPLKMRKVHAGTAPADELASYLVEETIEEFSETVSNYWLRQGPTRDRLAAFARSYLSVPATSTPSERCFSRAKFFIPQSRNRLSDENLSMSVLLDAFFKYQELSK